MFMAKGYMDLGDWTKMMVEQPDEYNRLVERQTGVRPATQKELDKLQARAQAIDEKNKIKEVPSSGYREVRVQYAREEQGLETEDMKAAGWKEIGLFGSVPSAGSILYTTVPLTASGAVYSNAPITQTVTGSNAVGNISGSYRQLPDGMWELVLPNQEGSLVNREIELAQLKDKVQQLEAELERRKQIEVLPDVDLHSQKSRKFREQ